MEGQIIFHTTGCCVEVKMNEPNLNESTEINLTTNIVWRSNLQTLHNHTLSWNNYEHKTIAYFVNVNMYIEHKYKICMKMTNSNLRHYLWEWGERKGIESSFHYIGDLLFLEKTKEIWSKWGKMLVSVKPTWWIHGRLKFFSVLFCTLERFYNFSLAFL